MSVSCKRKIPPLSRHPLCVTPLLFSDINDNPHKIKYSQGANKITPAGHPCILTLYFLFRSDIIDDHFWGLMYYGTVIKTYPLILQQFYGRWDLCESTAKTAKTIGQCLVCSPMKRIKKIPSLAWFQIRMELIRINLREKNPDPF